MLRKISLTIVIALSLTCYAFAQTNPPYPFVDDGVNIKLRNSGSRNVIFNTNFKVNQTGGIEESDSTGLRLLPYSTITGATTELRFYELAANGTNYIGFKSPDNLANSVTLVLPATDAIGTQCLSSNGTAQLGWSNCSGGSGNPGGSDMQVQYNNSGTFGGASSFTFNSATATLSVTHAALTDLTLVTPLSVTNGGLGTNVLPLNGLIYGNGTGAVFGTAQGGTNTVLIANDGPPVFSGHPTLATGIITKGQNAVELDPASGSNTGEIRFLELATNGTNYVGLKAPDSIAGNVIWKLPNADSTGTQCLASDGNGSLSWSTCSGGSGTPGGSNTQVQFNSSGSFAGNAGFVFNVGSATATITNLTLTNPLPLTSGGIGVATLAANGVVYGNGTSALLATAQGGTNTVLVANAGAPSFSAQPTLNVGIITKGQIAARFDPYGTLTGQTGELRFMELAANGSNYVGFKSSDSLAGNIIWTLPTADSTGNQCLSSNGSAILSWTNCSTTIGGSNQQVQFNNSGTLGGSSGLTWNNGSSTFTATNIVATNPIPVTSGGTGLATITANGVLYGNGTSAVNKTAQGGAKTVLAANNGAPSFVAQLPLNTGIQTFGQDAVEVNPFSTSTGNTGEIRFLELVANGTNYVGFKAADALAGNVVWTLPDADSSGTQCLASNGSGGLSWSACSGGTGTPGGSDTQIQYNSAGSFAGSSKMVFDGTTTTVDTLTATNTFIADGNTFKVDSSAHSVNFGVAAARTALLKLSGATSGTVSMTVAAAAGTWTFTLPTTAGTANQGLITNGSGVTSWANVITDTNTLTLSNKRIKKRVNSVATGSSLTPGGDADDVTIQVNTGTGGLTINAPSGTPDDGDCHWIRLKSTNARALTFSGIRASTDLPFPTTSTGSSKTDYFLVCRNATDSTWDYIAKNQGF